MTDEGELAYAIHSIVLKTPRRSTLPEALIPIHGSWSAARTRAWNPKIQP